MRIWQLDDYLFCHAEPPPRISIFVAYARLLKIYGIAECNTAARSTGDYWQNGCSREGFDGVPYMGLRFLLRVAAGSQHVVRHCVLNRTKSMR